MEKNYKPYYYGGVAQLGEHLPCKQGVMGSNPIISILGQSSQQVVPLSHSGDDGTAMT